MSIVRLRRRPECLGCGAGCWSTPRSDASRGGPAPDEQLPRFVDGFIDAVLKLREAASPPSPRQYQAALRRLEEYWCLRHRARH